MESPLEVDFDQPVVVLQVSPDVVVVP